MTRLALLSTLVLFTSYAQTAHMSISSSVLTSDATSYPEFANGSSFEELVTNHQQYDSQHQTYIKTFHPQEEHNRPKSLDGLTEIRGLTFNSDTVIVGRPVSRTSALTSNHKFIFSDYDVIVDTVLSDRKSLLSNAHNIIVTRAGGELLIGENHFRAIETEFPLFKLNEQYLFFLNKTESGSFLVRPSGAFALQASLITPARLHSSVQAGAYSVVQIEKEIIAASALNLRGEK